MWDLIVVTCPNRKSALSLEKRIEAHRRAELFDERTKVFCIEDADTGSGSGGATLNALFTAVELLSANRNSVANIEILKDKYVLVFHMGRAYPFDVAGKAFSTLPIRETNTDKLMNNFEMLYKFMTDSVAAESDPGLYVTSTDMVLLTSKQETLSIRNTPICALSCSVAGDVIRNHGLYDYHEKDGKKLVKNIHFNPDDTLVDTIKKNNMTFALVNGVIYMSYEISSILYQISSFPPISACTYNGSDNQESPISLSLFFDLLMPCCTDVTKDAYVNGLYKTNISYPASQRELLEKSRVALWNALRPYQIELRMLDASSQYIYFDCDTPMQRKALFTKLATTEGKFEKEFNTIETKDAITGSNAFVFNSIISGKNRLKIGEGSFVLNSEFHDVDVEIGDNCLVNDITTTKTPFKLPNDMFVQKTYVNFSVLKKPVPVFVTLGMNDNLKQAFNQMDWTIMNRTWSEFSTRTGIQEFDLWTHGDKTLLNAKLYPWFDPLCEFQDENAVIKTQLSFFDLDSFSLNVWRRSYRVSLEELMNLSDLDTLFSERTEIESKINAKIFIESICQQKCINFTSAIKQHISNGSVELLLSSLDELALANQHDLCLLPRVMAFICNVLLEMSGDLKVLKTGPRSNKYWTNAFDMIESGQIEAALVEMSRLRREWSCRRDLLLRAGRHYEGAMQCFIRLAVNKAYEFVSVRTCVEGKRTFEWVRAVCPARLDLAGAWSDTPPISYECAGSCVTNVAILINGEAPIGSKARVKQHKEGGVYYVEVIMKESADDCESDIKIKFHNIDDCRDFNKPTSIGCLLKAVLVFTKLVDLDSKETLSEQLAKKIGGSLEVHTWTNLPHGSGLGTSSILIGCVLSVVWKLMGLEASDTCLIYSILLVEQLMTTGGGWQDQCGGAYGGFKFTTCQQKLPMEIATKPLSFPENFDEMVNERLILVYTGVTRLAKDLLLSVLRNWYKLSFEICENVKELVRNGNDCAEAVTNGDLAKLGECINKHRINKLTMAPGSIPKSVQKLIDLLEPFTYGMALAGAGGGGFLYILTREANMKSKVQGIIDTSGFNMKIYDAKVSRQGIAIDYF